MSVRKRFLRVIETRMFSFKICVIVCVIIISTMAENPYCSVKCGEEVHTMCKFTGVGAACTGATGRRLTVRTKDDLITEHNEFRSAVAIGNVSRLPKASDMKKMYWDDELEMIAQRWADQCKFGHDKCRSRLSKEQVGQNINIWVSDSTTEHPFEMTSWKDEAKHVTKALIAKFGHTAKPVGHFTQMVWADSDRLGCALSVYLDDKSKSNELIVCNYAPAGNWHSRPVYRIGEPCSKCLCSGEFEGLCVRKGDPDVAGVTALASGVLILVSAQLILLFV